MKSPVGSAEIELALRRFILAELMNEPFDGQDPLADAAVDSLGIEQLVDYVFETWGIELGEDEIVEENFESLSALARLVESKC